MFAETAGQVSSAELRAALEQVLGRYFHAQRKISRLNRRRSVYSSSYWIENLLVEFKDGQKVRVVFKDVSASAVVAFAQNVRPRLLHQPEREIEVYQKILHPRLGTPICYGAVSSGKLQRYWLFLERVEGKHLWQFGRMEHWEEAARWLARLHTEFAVGGLPPGVARLDHLIQYDERFFQIWMARAEKFLRSKLLSTSPKTRRGFGRLADRYNRVVQTLRSLPRCFIHGDFYPSNVLIRRAGTEATEVGEGGSCLSGGVCPVDWEMAGIGPGLLDVASLASGDWSDVLKRKMVAAYRQALEPEKGWPPAMPDLMEALEYCQLYIAVQWLGWAEAWSPPEQHGRNWLREALRLAEKLGF
jgi:thiamine kinase-like enzyme